MHEKGKLFFEAGVEIKLSRLQLLPKKKGCWMWGLQLDNGGPEVGEMSPEIKRKVRKVRRKLGVYEGKYLTVLVFRSACEFSISDDNECSNRERIGMKII